MNDAAVVALSPETVLGEMKKNGVTHVVWLPDSETIWLQPVAPPSGFDHHRQKPQFPAPFAHSDVASAHKRAIFRADTGADTTGRRRADTET
jgi:hypothetical protein